MNGRLVLFGTIALVGPLALVGWARQGAGGGGGATPAATSGASEWAWDVMGPLEYGKRYTGTLVVTNGCDAVEAVSLSAPAGVVVPGSVLVPPAGQVDVKVHLQTPNRPDPPAGLAVPPGVDPAHYFCARLASRIQIVYPGRTGEPGCQPGRRDVTITGHVHYVPPLPPPPKLRIAGADACTVLWNTGQRPANAPDIDERCTEEIRRLATELRERVLETLLRLDPERWSWLPTSADIATMSTVELLAMKARASALLK